MLAGEERGLLARLWRVVMIMPMAGYALANGARQLMFDWRLRKPATLPVPVISVGNLSAGGTGKTPAVAWLVRELGERRVAVLSRGYRAKPEERNDEAELLARELPGVRHEQHRDRATAGRTALQADPAIEAFVLDDGFSHRQLARDLNLVLIDATRPFGFFELLPRGLLREPPAALRRADAVVMTRSDQVSRDDLDRLRARIRQRVGDDVPVATAAHRPVRLRTVGTNDEHSLESLRDQLVCVASGVGNPAAVERTVIGTGARLVARQPFGDHHHWSPADVATVTAAARAASATRVVITSKDEAKVASLVPADADPPWLVLDVEFALCESADADGIRDRIRSVVE